MMEEQATEFNVPSNAVATEDLSKVSMSTSNAVSESSKPNPALNQEVDPAKNVMVTTSIMTRARYKELEERQTEDKQSFRSSRSTRTGYSAISGYSKMSAKTRKAVLEAKLKSQRSLDALRRQHTIERLDFEEAQLMQKRRAEEEEFRLQKVREERLIQQECQLGEARLQAELNEAIAEISVENDDANVTVDNVVFKPTVNDIRSMTNEFENVVPTNEIGLHTSTFNVNNTVEPVVSVSSPFAAQVPLDNEPTQLVTNPPSNLKPSFLEPPALHPNASSFLPSRSTTNPGSSPYRCVAVTNPSQASVNAPSNVATLPNITINQAPNLEIKPPTFDGNPSTYYSFIDAFDTIIDSFVTDPKRKLFFLLQYTKGTAHTLVKGCQYMPADQGYKAARKLLRDNFGQKIQVATAYIESVVDGPVLNKKDKNALLEFSSKLTSCMCALDGMDYLQRMDNLDVVRKIVRRFPHQWIPSWERTVDQLLHVKQREVTIAVVSNFVAEKTRECMNFAAQPANPVVVPANATKTKAKSFASATHVSSPTQRRVCFLCSGPHFLNQCKIFRSQSFEERRAFAIKEKLCFCCLSKGHWSHKCTRQDPCRKPGCKERHTTLLHPPERPSADNSKGPDEQENKPQVNVSSGFVGAASRSGGKLPVVPVKVRLQGSQKFVVTRAFLDNGSTHSFITDNLVKQLKIEECPEIKVGTVTLNSKSPNYKKVKVIRNVELFDYSESNRLSLNVLLSTGQLPVSADDIPSQQDVSDIPEFSNIFIPEVDCDVGLLIGNDNLHVLQPQDVIAAEPGCYAVKTVLGWVVYCSKKESSAPVLKSFFVKAASKQLCSMCYDTVDSIQNAKVELSAEQTRFMNSVSGSIKHLENKHYEIALPLRNANLQMPSNRSQAEQRAGYLKRRLAKDPKFYKDYRDFVQDMIAKGYAEMITDSAGVSGKVWYIPHHGVYHPEKPGKIRVVFDGSCKYHGICLNDNLLQGPNITNTLIGVLLRFRRESIAIQGDIQGMFHQVHVPEGDRDLFRFLWWKDGNIEKPLEEYRMTVYLFGTVCSPSCANFALKHTASDNKEEFSTTAVDVLDNCFYVDDCLTSMPTAADATALVQELRCLLAEGGFKITKWISNSREVMESIPREEWSKEASNLDICIDNLPIERALGLSWNVEHDTLCFKVKVKTKPVTRRGILSIVSSVYDPLGFGAAVVQPMKVLLQRLCKLKLDWDEPIPMQEEIKWSAWLEKLPTLSSFQVPRCYKPSSFGKVTHIQLHHFSDASEEAYCAVSYLRLVNEFGKIHCILVYAKSRLVPIKRLTIPRLELSAATISICSDKMLKQELQMKQLSQASTFWTDSTTVLKYLNNDDKAFHTFVANRVQMIKDNSCTFQWKYVPTKLNPADDGSRGLSVSAFLQCDRWKNGPDFLWRPESYWPTQPSAINNIAEDDPEVKRAQATCFAATSKLPHFLDDLSQRCSTWDKLKRVCCWILLYKAKFKRCLHSSRTTDENICSKSNISFGNLTVEELKAAEAFIFHYLQEKHFETELSCLVRKRPLKKSSSIRNLDPILIEGLICVGGRISAAPIPNQAKHQIILPNDNHISTLIIHHTHKYSGHVGRQHVIALLRERLWIIKANSAVRRVLSDCILCRRRHGTTGSQKMADLPADRLIPDKPPFTHVGLDYFGPFNIRHGRSELKRYGVIFTCLTIRAVHIEIAHSMDTSSFIQALRRFIARRGQVEEIRSDNGSNFVGGERELRNCIAEWNQTQIHSFLVQKGIKWIFNVPTASHHGGVWERQIRSIRRILASICNEQRLTDESLITFMCEVESILNSRPITTVSDDPNDLEPLTPNHLLLMKKESSLPPGIFNKTDLYSRRRWKQVQHLANVFWSRWIKEYLPSLQKRQQWHKAKQNLKTGDIVLVTDNAPRNYWLLGRVLETFPDKYGSVRSVRIQTQHSVLDRPVTKLCLILAVD